MELYKTKAGVYVAQTHYGEWAAKQAGFTWAKTEKVWTTQDPQKALELSATTGLSYTSVDSIGIPSTPPPTIAHPTGDLWPTVVEGRYAITDPTDHVLKFYRVDKPQEGKWMGFTFLKVMASDTLWPIKDPATKKMLLDVIARDPHAAMAKYGQALGECGYCGRTLTDAESRMIGIGPVCRKSLGFIQVDAR